MKSIKKLLKHSQFAYTMRHNKRMRIAVYAILAVTVLAVCLLIYSNQRHQKIYDVKHSSDSDSSSYTVIYNGESYEYNSKISTILLIGIDSTGKMETSTDYGEQARADNIDLIIFNREDKTVKVLPVSRDTITEVMTYSAQGYETGKTTTHLGFAFSFGNGGGASSKNTCNAVSDLLYGVSIYRYVTTNIDSIGYANQLIGGVTVTVPNNDLADKYPEMKKGAKVELTDDNVADFLRYRDTDKDASNNSRMERQQAFLTAYIDKLKTMTEDDYIDMWKQLKSDKSKISTNMSEKMFLNLIGNIKEYSYNPATDNLKIEGTDGEEDGYDVFYPDKDRLKELVINTFFKKAEDK